MFFHPQDLWIFQTEVVPFMGTAALIYLRVMTSIWWDLWTE